MYFSHENIIDHETYIEGVENERKKKKKKTMYIILYERNKIVIGIAMIIGMLKLLKM